MKWLKPEDVATEVAKGIEAAKLVTQLNWWQLAHATEEELKETPLPLPEYIRYRMSALCMMFNRNPDDMHRKGDCDKCPFDVTDYKSVWYEVYETMPDKTTVDYPAFHVAAEAMYQKTLKVK